MFYPSIMVKKVYGLSNPYHLSMYGIYGIFTYIYHKKLGECM